MHVSESVRMGEEKKTDWETDEEKELDIRNVFVIMTIHIL